MRLRFVGLHEDGTSLVFTDPEGEQEFLVPVDDRLRSALRNITPPGTSGPAAPHGSVDHVTPRQVQSMMRAGQDAEEIAAAIGWAADRVRKFESPILAERDFIATTAQASHVRGRVVDGVFPSLGPRVRERLDVRGVAPSDVRWDAIRPEGGGWKVQVIFTAGGRVRHATWAFDLSGRTVEALDDEARWLSEDEQELPAGPNGVLVPGEDGTADLVSTIREHNKARGRRGRRGAARQDAESESAQESGNEPEREDDARAAEPAAPESASDLENASTTETEIDTGQTDLDDAELHDADLDDADLDEADRARPDSSESEATAPDSGVLPLDDLTDPESEDPATPAEWADETADGPAGLLGRRRRRGRELRPAHLRHKTAVEDAPHAGEPEATLDDFFGAQDEGDPASQGAEDQGGADDPGGTEEPEGDAPSRRKNRTSVPSWDDIMFGGSRGQR